jgi:hypothetical protein
MVIIVKSKTMVKDMKKIKNIYQVEKILEENKMEIKDDWIFYNFWQKVDIKDNKKECWNWIAGIDTAGYGQFYLSSHQPARAHRIVYILVKGSISEGLQVQHQCNNRLCCNPNHLELGDNSKNMQYMLKCDRGNKAVGENHGNAILTDDQVRNIHKLYNEQRKLHPEFLRKKWKITEPIAKKFEVSRSTINMIINGKSWCHIYEEFYEK